MSHLRRMFATDRQAMTHLSLGAIFVFGIAAKGDNLGSTNYSPNQTAVPARATATVEATVNPERHMLINAEYGRLPLSFEPNEGQSDSRVKFLSTGAGYVLFLTTTEAVLSLRIPERGRESKRSTDTTSLPLSPGRKPAESRYSVLRIKLVHANRNSQINGVDQLAGRSNYLVGNDRRNWHASIAMYRGVKYAGVYPGIDLLYYGDQRQLEYDFVLAPESDPNRIELSFAGAERLRVDSHGNLVVEMKGGQVIEPAPVIYQEIGGTRRPVTGGYVLKSPDRVGFRLASYDRHHPVTIDPILVYSTFLGGTDIDLANGVAVDSSGNAYITGTTSSLDFPTTSGALQTTEGGDPVGANAFVSKLDSSGSTLVYSTYLGGNDSDFGNGVAVDLSGNAYVTGLTFSTDFPTTAGAVQGMGAGRGDAFVSKLNSTGSALVYSTYVGGSNYDEGFGVAPDFSGNAYVTGQTDSGDFPTTEGVLQSTGNGSFAAFVTKLNSGGSALVYSTYLDGSGSDAGKAIALDSSGNTYVTGQTLSTDFPATAGSLQAAAVGGQDGFVSKLNSSGSKLVYSTYLGGSDDDVGRGIALDSSGNAYVTGLTYSTDFPNTPGALQTALSGFEDAFVSKLNSTGSALIYSTYLGGSACTPVGGEPCFAQDFGSGIAVDSAGNAYVTGLTYSTDFPTTSGALQTTQAGRGDAFVSKLNDSGSALVYSTYLGGGVSLDSGASIAVDSSGNAYITGDTQSPDFPTTAGALQTTFGGVSNPFVSKISFGGPEHKIVTSPSGGTTVSGPVAISTQRGEGVKWLNVYVDGTYLASSPPFTFSWDSSTWAGGEHKISAVAYGYNDQESGRDEVSVKVSNPAVAITQPAQSSSVSGIVTIDTESTLDVKWLNLYIDGEYFASSPPFGFRWDSVSVSDGTHSISANGYDPTGTLLGSTSITVQVQNSPLTITAPR